jgi:hypothetical protein
VVANRKTIPQDVTSYVIARTLGVIDDTKASTSDRDKTDEMMSNSNPTILVHDESQGASLTTDFPSPSTSGILAAREHESRLRESTMRHKPPSSIDLEPSSHYFTTSGSGDTLSGVGLFSPAASRPPSPLVERRSLLPEDVTRRRDGNSSWHSTLGSSSGESSTLLEGVEDDGVELFTSIRRRPDVNRYHEEQP